MMTTRLTKVLTAALALGGSVVAAPVDSALEKRQFSYGSTKVRGVNLGGWFVLEPWITPSIFSLGSGVVDEYTYSKALGKSKAKSELTDHWKKWITQADFSAIAGAGLNHVRIPIGYWALSPLKDDPYVQGQLPFLDQAITWARDAGLKVMLDLHGAPGSQNGFDNSGKLGPVEWQQGDTVQQTLDALSKLSDRYKKDTDVVASIQLLNEPLGSSLNLGGVESFYTNGIKTVRSKIANVPIVIHDAFEDFSTYWNGKFTGQNVVLDTHQYQIFTNEVVAKSPDEHNKAAGDIGNKLAGLDKPGVVGEWTGAQTDCAKWLNGYGKGARYDGTFTNSDGGSNYVGSCDGKYTGSVKALSSDDKKNVKSFIQAQLKAYEKGAGWIFWTWKTESAPEWNMQDLLTEGLFPKQS